MSLTQLAKDNDWVSIRQAIAKLSKKLDYTSSPVFAGLTVTGLTASRLLSTNTNKGLASVTNLTSWIAGTANEINVADDGDGTITIGLVDPLIVGKGGTGVATLTDGGILLGSGTGAITALGRATDGQIPIGSTGLDPVLGTLTAGTGIGIANAAGSITVSSTITQYTDALARAAISETVTGLDYNSTSGVLSLTTGYVIPTTTQETNWGKSYTHVTSTGDDHTWLNQDMTTNASPVLTGLELKESLVTLDSYTKLLLHADGLNNSVTVGINDSSFSGHSPTVNGNAKVSTAQSKFGGSSFVFDGTGDYINVPSSTDFNYGTGDFTIDCWIYINVDPVAEACITAGVTYGSVGMGFNVTQGLWMGRSGIAKDLAAATDISIETWHHVAVTRESGFVRLFVDGVIVQQGGWAYDCPTTAVNIGIDVDNASNPFNGYIDEFRISTGIARWTADFTPPTKPYGDGTFGRIGIGYPTVKNGGLAVRDWFGLGIDTPLRKFHLYDPYGSAEMLLERGDQAADCKRFNIYISSNKTFFRALNDAGDGGLNWLYCANSTGEITLNYPLVEEQSLFLTEQAGDLADRAGKGQIWVKNTTPNELWFTDDTDGAIKINHNLTTDIDHDALTNFVSDKHVVHSTWAGTTNITTLGTIVTGVWNGTDIAIADGGTGQGTAQAAINALTAVSGATNEHVLTKDTATGNAIFKAASGGVTSYTALSTLDGTTNVIGAELEELTNGSTTTLHTHTGLGSGLSHVSAYRASDQTIGSGSWTTIQFANETYDTQSDFNTGTYTFTAPANGYYTISALVEISSTIAAGKTVYIRIYKSGTTQMAYSAVRGATVAPFLVVVQTVYLAVTNTIVIQLYQDTGGNITVAGAASNSGTNLSIDRIIT